MAPDPEGVFSRERVRDLGVSRAQVQSRGVRR
jgi:uncharacterized protein YjiS (DUF1127 family)